MLISQLLEFIKLGSVFLLQKIIQLSSSNDVYCTIVLLCNFYMLLNIVINTCNSTNAYNCYLMQISFLCHTCGYRCTFSIKSVTLLLSVHNRSGDRLNYGNVKPEVQTIVMACSVNFPRRFVTPYNRFHFKLSFHVRECLDPTAMRTMNKIVIKPVYYIAKRMQLSYIIENVPTQ